ncbi:hypothetical protein DR046_15740 [Jannaschia formosa]|nr:hypothetical protein DR046_15740 [Jannaschia formosa]
MTMQDTIGVDVSKDHLDACDAASKDHRRFSNDAAGLTALCRRARKRGDVVVVFEASGACHRDLERMLSRQELPFAKVNPRQARRFTEAVGQVAKTDRIDAAILARMGRALDLAPSAVLPAYMSELQDLLVSRRGLIRDRAAAQTRLKTAKPLRCFCAASSCSVSRRSSGGSRRSTAPCRPSSTRTRTSALAERSWSASRASTGLLAVDLARHAVRRKLGAVHLVICLCRGLLLGALRPARRGRRGDAALRLAAPGGLVRWLPHRPGGDQAPLDGQDAREERQGGPEAARACDRRPDRPGSLRCAARLARAAPGRAGRLTGPDCLCRLSGQELQPSLRSSDVAASVPKPASMARRNTRSGQISAR